MLAHGLLFLLQLYLLQVWTWCKDWRQKCLISYLNMSISAVGAERVAATAAALSRAEPLVVFRAFIATLPCNLVVLGVIIPSLFIVIVSLALWLTCPLADILKSQLERLERFRMILSLALIFISCSWLLPPLSHRLDFSLEKSSRLLYRNLRWQPFLFLHVIVNPPLLTTWHHSCITLAVDKLGRNG